VPKKPSWLGWTALILPAVLLIAFVVTSNKPTLHTDPPLIAKQIASPDGALSRIADPAGALTARLKKRFPAGTRAADMRLALEAEGFAQVRENLRCKPADPSQAGHRLVCWTPPHPERQLVYAWGRDDCNEAVSIRWDEDAHGNLGRLDAAYRVLCR
jgi:hypothetical protein